MMHPAEDRFVVVYRGPAAVVRACRLCNHIRRLRRGVGRGEGMREGNKQRGVLIQHIKTEHPLDYAQAMRPAHSPSEDRGEA